MNERMIELYKEAGEFAYKICKEEGRTGGHSDHIWNTLSTGKFAELIVGECMEQGATLAKHYINTHNEQEQALLLASIADFSNHIKQHFGVE